jgi:hypothetical protein
MAKLYRELSLATQTSFASLNQAAQQADLRRSIADVPGGFAKKKVARRTYWYHQVRNPDGSLIQTYVGPDDETTRLLIQRHADAKARSGRKHLVGMARAAIELGCAPIPPAHARVIERLAERGLFSAGGILVGTHAFLAYQNHFGVEWTVPHATLDLDFAHAGPNVSLALPENLRLDAVGAIESLQMGFIPNHSRTSYTKEDEPDFDLDFLTSCSRTGEAPVRLDRFNLTMQPLKFMELSLEDPMRATLVWRNGPIVVNLPQPQRYAVHKLIVFGERLQSQRVKANKDLAQAAALLDYLLDHDAAELSAVWEDVLARGPGWRKRLEQGQRALVSRYGEGEFAPRLARARVPG